MISEEIEFHAPAELPAALQLLAERGADVTLLSGGMSLLPMMNVGLATPNLVVSLNHILELDFVREDVESITLGAGVRHAEVADNELVREHCPVLADAASRIGDVQVRNRGTIGGSVAHADPAADYLPVLSLLDARVKLVSATGQRSMPIGDFLVDMFINARESTELLAQVVIPKIPAGASAAYRRFARVEGSFPIVNAAALWDPERRTVKVAVGGGVGPRPVLLDVSEHFSERLRETGLEAIGAAAYEATAGAISDTVSDSEYRREMARVFARRAVKQAAQRDGGANSA